MTKNPLSDGVVPLKTTPKKSRSLFDQVSRLARLLSDDDLEKLRQVACSMQKSRKQRAVVSSRCNSK